MNKYIIARGKRKELYILKYILKKKTQNKTKNSELEKRLENKIIILKYWYQKPLRSYMYTCMQTKYQKEKSW